MFIEQLTDGEVVELLKRTFRRDIEEFKIVERFSDMFHVSYYAKNMNGSRTKYMEAISDFEIFSLDHNKIHIRSKRFDTFMYEKFGNEYVGWLFSHYNIPREFMNPKCRE